MSEPEAKYTRDITTREAFENALPELPKGQIIDLYLDALDQIRVLKAQVKKFEDTRDWGGS